MGAIDECTDVALSTIAALLRGGITAELGKTEDGTDVLAKVWEDPRDLLLLNAATELPALALYRGRERRIQRSSTSVVQRITVRFDYTLPATSKESRAGRWPALQTVWNTAVDILFAGKHAQVESGAMVLRAASISIDRATFEMTPGFAEHGGQSYPIARGSFDVEWDPRSVDVSAIDRFLSFHASYDLVQTDDTEHTPSQPGVSTGEGPVETNLQGYGATALPFDAFESRLAAAHSVARRLLTSWTGGLVVLRTGGALHQIGYDPDDNTLDVATIAALCGASDGFLVSVLDQTGHGYHHTQPSEARQPKLYDGATGQVLLDGLAAADFDGAVAPGDDGFAIAQTAGASFGLNGTTGLTLYWRGRINAHASSAALMGLGSWQNEVFWVYLDTVADRITCSIRSGKRDFASAYVGVASKFVARIREGAPVSTISLRQNGTELAQATITNGHEMLNQLDGTGRHLGTSIFGEALSARWVEAAVLTEALSDDEAAALEAA